MAVFASVGHRFGAQSASGVGRDVNRSIEYEMSSKLSSVSHEGFRLDSERDLKPFLEAARITVVRLSVAAVSASGLVLALIAGPCLGQSGEPTPQEISDAYRSKQGEGGTFIPGLRWERWRIKEIRGWSLKFKRLGEGPSVGVGSLGIRGRRYKAVAKKSDTCAEYHIIDRMPVPPNPQIKESLTVEPQRIHLCR